MVLEVQRKNKIMLSERFLNTITYYRLNQIELNGTSTTSKIISVAPKVMANTISIYPNPTKNQLNIDLGNERLSNKIFMYI